MSAENNRLFSLVSELDPANHSDSEIFEIVEEHTVNGGNPIVALYETSKASVDSRTHPLFILPWEAEDACYENRIGKFVGDTVQNLGHADSIILVKFFGDYVA